MSESDDLAGSGRSEPGHNPHPGVPEPPGGWIEFEDPAPEADIPEAETSPPPPPPIDEFGAADASQTEAVDGGTRRRWPLALGIGLLAFAGVGVAAFFLLGTDDGIDYPDEWATEVLAFVEIVEQERDLEFEHPVHVDFLSEDEFRAQVTSDESELTDEDRESIEQSTGLLRAVGLVQGELDLFEASNDLTGEGVVGFYSFEDKRIRMRGEELTPARKSTLVHELTHALQDQHFDLGARRDAYAEAEDDAGDTAFDAIVEGDGRRIETAYIATLSDEELADLEADELAEAEEFESNAEDIPQVLQTLFGSPYALGEVMLTLAVEIDGNDAVDKLFEDPPTNEEHLFDPWTLLLDHDTAKEVTEPKVSDGEEFDRGAFGALGWFLVLAERVDLLTALDATDGWGGDAYVGFDRDGVTCARMTYRADSAADLDQMEAALQEWVAAAPGTEASVERSGAQLEFESCDPGPDAAVGKDASADALGLALTRSYLSLGLLQSGVLDVQARCLSDALVHEYSVESLNDPTFGADDPAAQQRIQELAFDCR
ncbi:hypothetical protein [Actinospongicola halichondriae]|uniref:hypothetical protein n=1 Tax=Actinospongicola halichondriae TaxID=3236844 RepID=UPI003D4DF7CA